MLSVDITEACRIYYFQFCLISTGFLVAKQTFEAATVHTRKCQMFAKINATF